MTASTLRRTERRLALLLSTDAFEEFYGRGLGLDRERYLREYRNDWSWEYVRALRDEGYETFLYVATTEDDAVHSLEETTVRFVALGHVDQLWRQVRTLRRSPPGRYLHQWINARSLLPGLRRALIEDSIDTLLVQEYWTGRWDALSTMNIPLVAIDQGQPDRREIKRLKSRTLPRAHAVVVQTETEARKVSRHGGQPTIIPNGVDTTFYAPLAEVAQVPGQLLVVARLLDVQKRISDSLRALAQLGDSFTLRIIGNGPDEQMLRTLANQLGIDGRVSFDGLLLERPRMVEAMNQCEVFLLPSAYEGLPMALLEAIACGAAVVGSDIPPIADVLARSEAGLVVPVGDIDALAAAIRQAQAERPALGAAARRLASERYSLQSMGRALSQVIGL